MTTWIAILEQSLTDYTSEQPHYAVSREFNFQVYCGNNSCEAEHSCDKSHKGMCVCVCVCVDQLE
jgi:hypothetical protein